MALVNGGYLHYMEMKKFLKILLLWNPSSDFKIIWQGCSLGDPCSCEWELLALYGHDEILENSLSLKPLVRFKKKKIPKCSLGDPFENLFVNFDPSRNMVLVDGGYLLLYRNEKFLKILPFETDGQISKWTLQVTFWKLLNKIINLVSIPQKKKKKKKKNRLWLSQKFRWAIQGHLGPLVFLKHLAQHCFETGSSRTLHAIW